MMMLVAPPVVRLVTTMLLDAGMSARFKAELVAFKALIGAATVPAVPESVNAPFAKLIVLVPPPLTMYLAITAPPLALMEPAVPGVRVPVTEARVRVLFTFNVAPTLSIG